MVGSSSESGAKVVELAMAVRRIFDIQTVEPMSGIGRMAVLQIIILDYMIYVLKTPHLHTVAHGIVKALRLSDADL